MTPNIRDKPSSGIPNINDAGRHDEPPNTAIAATL
jgi:hypothetical protein